MQAEGTSIPVSRPFLWGNEETAVREALVHLSLSGNSESVRSFERSFAEWLGVPHAMAVANGTAAVHLALLGLGIGAGDEVIVGDFVMGSPLFAILYCGATPVLVDCDATWNLDPAAVREAITDRTRAVLVVHTYGHPADMAAISETAARHGIPVVEDVAEAMGGAAHGRSAGAWGAVACFSFYSNKLVTSGEGGMVVTRDPALAAEVSSLRNMCFGVGEEMRFTHRRVGYNYRMGGLQAALVQAQLEHVDGAISERAHLDRLYRRALDGVDGLTLPPRAPWADRSYWTFGVLLDPERTPPRGAVQARLAAYGIETRRFFEAAHRQPFVRSGLTDRDLPGASRLADQGLYLPLFVGQREDDVELVTERLVRCLR